MTDRKLANEIAGIDGLKMVHFYSLSGGKGPLYGILAYYRDRVINLCNTDNGFTALLDRLIMVYDREIRTGEIIADETTEQVLRRANDFRPVSLEKALAGYEERSVSLVVPKAFSFIYLLPVIKYVIRTVYGEELVFDELSPQWFGKGVLDAQRNGKRLHFPYRIASAAGECYDILVRNVLADGNEWKIEITFGYDRITVSFYDRYYLCKGSLQCTLSSEGARVSCVMQKNGETVLVTEPEAVPLQGSMPADAVRSLTGIDSGWKAYRMPWGDTVYAASADDTEYRVLQSEGNGMAISYGLCFRYPGGEEKASMPFGEYAFRLYEREDIRELHFLELEQPGSGRYRQDYEGRYYAGQI